MGQPLANSKKKHPWQGCPGSGRLATASVKKKGRGLCGRASLFSVHLISADSHFFHDLFMCACSRCLLVSHSIYLHACAEVSLLLCEVSLRMWKNVSCVQVANRVFAQLLLTRLVVNEKASVRMNVCIHKNLILGIEVSLCPSRGFLGIIF